MPGVTLHLGDCRDVLKGMEAGSADAVVTDPPYGLKFMGKGWDHGCPGVEFWEAIRRVLKPGGYLLAFGGTRTYHRQACALEDSGFVIRDTLMWLYGQGFPKGKACLKPGWEPITLAWNPAPRVNTLNIDACRVGTDDDMHRTRNGPRNGAVMNCARDGSLCKAVVSGHPAGRWPANLILTHHPDCRPCGTNCVKSNGHFPASRGKGGLGTIGHAGQEGLEERYTAGEEVTAWDCHESCPVAALDRQSGECGGSGQGKPQANTYRHDNAVFGKFDTHAPFSYDARGGASRFFPTFAWSADDFATFLYCPKASKADRGEGNRHPTVKPTALMRWLCRLVTPPGGLILDPFLGSGTTAVAAHREGFRCVGVESDPESLAASERRVAAARDEHPLLAGSA